LRRYKSRQNDCADSMKFPTVENMSELTRIEAGIGFLCGIMLGAISALVLILFFTPWEWYFKVFSFIGSAGIIGSLYMSLSQQIVMRRNYIATRKMMNEVNEKSSKVIKEKTK